MKPMNLFVGGIGGMLFLHFDILSQNIYILNIPIVYTVDYADNENHLVEHTSFD